MSSVMHSPAALTDEREVKAAIRDAGYTISDKSSNVSAPKSESNGTEPTSAEG